ncbi:MAG: energy-coupling factor transporter transmembrane component T family protein [Promethearchaeota archaeon]
MSFRIMAAFDFMDLKSFMHKLDPRVKFIMLISYTSIIFSFYHILFQIIILISLIPFIVNSHIGKNLMVSFKNMLFLFVFIIIINSALVSFDLGLEMSLRLINIMIVFSLFFQTTNPDDLTQALTKMFVPYHIAFTISLAFRFVPTLAKEAETIMDAQKSRGLDLTEKGMFKQLRNFIPLVVPLITNSIKRANYIAESLETRAFGDNKNRTYLYPLKLHFRDYMTMTFFIALMVISFFLKAHPNLIPQILFYRVPF